MIIEVLMAFRYEIKNQGLHLLVTSHGSPDTLDKFFDYIMAVVFTAIKEGLSCILVDETDVSNKFDAYDSVLMSEKFDENSLQFLGIRVALIARPHNLTGYKNLETSLQNRSFNMKAFDDLKEGKTWLLRACVLTDEAI